MNMKNCHIWLLSTIFWTKKVYWRLPDEVWILIIEILCPLVVVYSQCCFLRLFKVRRAQKWMFPFTFSFISSKISGFYDYHWRFYLVLGWSRFRLVANATVLPSFPMEKNLQIQVSMKMASSIVLIARCGAIPNQTHIHSFRHECVAR